MTTLQAEPTSKVIVKPVLPKVHGIRLAEELGKIPFITASYDRLFKFVRAEIELLCPSTKQLFIELVNAAGYILTIETKAKRITDQLEDEDDFHYVANISVDPLLEKPFSVVIAEYQPNHTFQIIPNGEWEGTSAEVDKDLPQHIRMVTLLRMNGRNFRKLHGDILGMLHIFRDECRREYAESTILEAPTSLW